MKSPHILDKTILEHNPQSLSSAQPFFGAYTKWLPTFYTFYKKKEKSLRSFDNSNSSQDDSTAKEFAPTEHEVRQKIPLSTHFKIARYRFKLLTSSTHSLFAWIHEGVSHNRYTQQIAGRKVWLQGPAGDYTQFLTELERRLCALTPRGKKKIIKMCEHYALDLLCVSQTPLILNILCRHGFDINLKIKKIIFNSRLGNSTMITPLPIEILRERTCAYRFEYARILLSQGVNVDYNLTQNNAHFFNSLEELKAHPHLSLQTQKLAGYLNLFFLHNKHSVFEALLYEYATLDPERYSHSELLQAEGIILDMLKILEKTKQIKYLSPQSEDAPTPIFFLTTARHSLSGVFEYLLQFEKGYTRYMGHQDGKLISLALSLAYKNSSYNSPLHYFELYLKTQNFSLSELLAIELEFKEPVFEIIPEVWDILKSYIERESFSSQVEIPSAHPIKKTKPHKI